MGQDNVGPYLPREGQELPDTGDEIGCLAGKMRAAVGADDDMPQAVELTHLPGLSEVAGRDAGAIAAYVQLIDERPAEQDVRRVQHVDPNNGSTRRLAHCHSGGQNVALIGT